jgi:hypothetical protein
MSSYSGSSVYSSLDEKEILQDRRALNEKLRRHQQSHPERNAHDNKFDSGVDVDIENAEDEPYHEEDEEEEMEGLNSLQRAIRGENQSPSAEIYSYDRDAAEKKEHNLQGNRALIHDDYIRRHTPPTECNHKALRHYSSRMISIPTHQSSNKRVKSIFYLLLSLAIIISFGFFLVSCKLMTYGT